MSSAERREFFTKFTDESLGKFINTEFEKAMISKQKTALTDWAKSVFTPEAKAKPTYQNVLNKIKTLDDLGVLNPKSEQAFLQDLVAEKLGISVSPEEVKAISERAKKIDEAQVALGSDLGSPAELQKNLDFFKAKKEMDDYLLSLTPSHGLKILTSTIRRGLMLASVKSPILNIGSNTELAITEALVRRLSGGSVRGANNGLAIDYVKMVNKVYQATGYDLSRMTSLSDTGASGSRFFGDIVHSQGPGAVRAVGRVVEDIVFKQLMGAPDAAFAAAHFADSVNLAAMKIAKGDKVAATAMMQDAMRIEPQTPEGELLRQQGILDAQTATWTNDTWGSEASLKIRKILNDLSGDLRLGDQLSPFVKTPANVISTGMDYAGLGIPKALIDTFNAFRNGDLGGKQYQQKTYRNLTRAGFGLITAFIIVSQLKDDDFVGAYDPARAQIEQLRNSNTNSIRVGGKWINTAWLGPLAVSVTAMMYARKYGKTGPEKLLSYPQGLALNVLDLPVVTDLRSIYDSWKSRGNQTPAEMASAAGDSLTDYASSFIIPSFFSDTARVIDPYERQTGKGVQKLESKIPGLRQTLPIKTNIFGEQMTGENAWSDILFGARVKTDKETAVVKEINDVAVATGKSINFTNWDKSNSATLAQFKQKFGAYSYEQGKARYGYQLKTRLEETIKNKKYQKLSDEDKLKVLNGLDADAMDKVFSQFHFKYKKPVTKKIKL